mmetsp:Transcript_15257/g.45787  ORF Transcript_15257/g.45787 Transcript_15257/m.45787 type:complete len:116 (-) Transcript_15257:198-545(-)
MSRIDAIFFGFGLLLDLAATSWTRRDLLDSARVGPVLDALDELGCIERPFGRGSWRHGSHASPSTKAWATDGTGVYTVGDHIASLLDPRLEVTGLSGDGLLLSADSLALRRLALG